MNIRQTFVLFFILIQSISGFAQFRNVMITDRYDPNEPAICINPKDPSLIMAGCNTWGLMISQDSGQTWNSPGLYSNWSVWGDPCIVTDTAGDFYYFHLSNYPQGNWIDRIVAQKYVVDQQQWTVDTFTGLNGTKAQDKEWAVVDPRNNHIYLTWTQFDSYGSSNPADSSHIMFSKSTDAGVSWSQAIRINDKGGNCTDGDTTVEGAVPAVGPNGELYVAWASQEGLMFDKSLDGGQTWMAQDQKISDMPGGWDFHVPGIYRCNGLPVTTCDLSSGPHRGTLYVNWTDQRNGTDNTDVWLIKSTDGGSTWSQPTKVNDDNSGRHQFFTWMTIDTYTGYLYFVFYDRRNYADNQTDVYLAISKDGGQSFQNYMISESPFTPRDDVFFGDYTNISVHDGMIRPIWTRLDSSTARLTIWTALADEPHLGITPPVCPEGQDDDLSVYPNPGREMAVIAYKLRQKETVSLHVVDNTGRKLTTLIAEQQQNPGRYIQRFYPESMRLKPGLYFFVLQTDSKKVVKKFIVN